MANKFKYPAEVYFSHSNLFSTGAEEIFGDFTMTRPYFLMLCFHADILVNKVGVYSDELFMLSQSVGYIQEYYFALKTVTGTVL